MLTLTFEPKQQTASLRAAGYTVASLKLAGFRWTSGAWTAIPTESSQRAYNQIMDTLHGMEHEHDAKPGRSERQVCTARSDHSCAECGRPIGTGESAMMIKDMECGTFNYRWLCTCCYDCALEVA